MRANEHPSGNGQPDAPGWQTFDADRSPPASVQSPSPSSGIPRVAVDGYDVQIRVRMPMTVKVAGDV